MVAAKGKVTITLFEENKDEELNANFCRHSIEYRNICFLRVNASKAHDIVDTHIDEEEYPIFKLFRSGIAIQETKDYVELYNIFDKHNKEPPYLFESNLYGIYDLKQFDSATRMAEGRIVGIIFFE